MKASEPLLAPALAQVAISLAAIFKLSSIDMEDHAALTALITFAWAAAAAVFELVKRNQVTPVEKAVENVTKVLEKNGANPDNVTRAADTIRAGEPVILPPTVRE